MQTIPRCFLYCLALMGLLGCAQETVDEVLVDTTSPDSQALSQLMDDIWDSAIEKSAYLRLQQGLPILMIEDFTLE